MKKTLKSAEFIFMIICLVIDVCAIFYFGSKWNKFTLSTSFVFIVSMINFLTKSK